MTDTNMSPTSEPTTATTATTTTAGPTTIINTTTTPPTNHEPSLANATSTTPPLVSTETRPKDPRIAALHALFPDYDDLILYSVLDSVGGDQDRAIDALLGMSDPEYKGEPAAAAGASAVQEPGLTQTELDEQFARRLLMEEQDQQQAAWLAAREARRPQLQRQDSQPQRQPTPGSGQGQAGDTMAEIQQQIGKFAETGKKTFNNIFNKVKTKIQEMDQSRASSANSYDPAAYEQRTYQDQDQPYVPYATRPHPNSRSTSSHAQAQQPAYYDPNSNEPVSLSPPLAAQGYDTTLALTSHSHTPPNASSTNAGLGASISPSNDIARPPSGLTSPPVDGSKFGILPKRPVTLLRPGEPTQLQRSQSQDESDDGLEYAESPFEETKK